MSERGLQKLRQRATTLLRKSEELHELMMRRFGEDGMVAGDNATDFSDNLQQAAIDVCDILDRAAGQKPPTPLEIGRRQRQGGSDG